MGNDSCAAVQALLADWAGRVECQGWFVTAVALAWGDGFDFDSFFGFMSEKGRLIAQGAISARRFRYRGGICVVEVNFYPTNCVVDEKYALLNNPFFFHRR